MSAMRPAMEQVQILVQALEKEILRLPKKSATLDSVQCSSLSSTRRGAADRARHPAAGGQECLGYARRWEEFHAGRMMKAVEG